MNDFEGCNILERQRRTVSFKDRSMLHDLTCACYRMLAKRLRALFV